MNARERADLDRHITGNGGEDQHPETDGERFARKLRKLAKAGEKAQGQWGRSAVVMLNAAARYIEQRDESDLLEASKKFLAFYEDLAKSNPGFMGHLCLQNYQRWNEAMIELPAAIAKAEAQ